MRHSSKLVELPAEIGVLSSIRENIMACSCDMALRRRACLACEEALANIVMYSGATRIRFDVVETDGELRMMLLDNGKPFDSTAVVVPEKDFNDLDSGGMGVQLIRDLASDLSYRREADANNLIIVMREAQPNEFQDEASGHS